MRCEGNRNSSEQERRIREAIRSTGEVRADEAFRARLKREFVEGTLSEPAASRTDQRPRRLPRWSWVLVPAAAAAAILLFVLFLPAPGPTWEFQAVRGEGQVEIDGQSLAVDDAVLLARALVAGGRIRVPEKISLDLRLDDRLVLELDEEADVTLPVPAPPKSGGPLVAEVHQGELRIKTGPGFPGEAMHILTPEGRTEIVGTVISVYRGEGYTCVCVLEGIALVGEDEARLEEVPEGMLKIMFDDGSEAIVTDIASSHEADLQEFSERYRELFVPVE